MRKKELGFKERNGLFNKASTETLNKNDEKIIFVKENDFESGYSDSDINDYLRNLAELKYESTDESIKEICK